SAGPLDTAKNYFNNLRSGVGGFWDRIDDHVTSLTFWINFGIVLAIVFVLIQSYEALKNLREGRAENMIILYILIIVIAIIIAVHLGPNRIYHHQYIRWLFNTNIIINVVIVYIIIELIFTFFGTQLPFIERLLRRGERGEPQQGFANILRYLVPIIISLLIVYHVAQVDTKGIPTNTSLIWQSDFWKSIERIGFGDRINNKIGDWRGSYTNANGDTRYGVLWWKPIRTGVVPPTIQLGNTSVPSPALPPIVIFLIVWVLLRATIGRIITPEMFGQDAQGARDTENLELGANDIRTILILYLAAAITARGIEVNNLIMFVRIFLMWHIYRALESMDILPGVRGTQTTGGTTTGMSVPGRVMTAWIVSTLLIRLLIDRNTPVDLGWIWAIVAFEIVFQLAIPITMTIVNLITAAVAHPGIAGMVIGTGVLSQMGLVRDNI
ncbi:MAG: hypothetical protein AABY14_03850, partial [Nanoarchaeota archaeon]